MKGKNDFKVNNDSAAKKVEEAYDTLSSSQITQQQLQRFQRNPFFLVHVLLDKFPFGLSRNQNANYR